MEWKKEEKNEHHSVKISNFDVQCLEKVNSKLVLYIGFKRFICNIR